MESRFFLDGDSALTHDASFNLRKSINVSAQDTEKTTKYTIEYDRRWRLHRGYEGAARWLRGYGVR
jgi:hypothetical protein